MKIRFISFILLINSFIATSQVQKLENYKNFDRELVTFGVQLGVNKNNYTLIPEKDAFNKYGYTAIENIAQPGAQVGMLISLKLGTPIARLRLIPTFSFQERVINYYTLPKETGGKEGFNQERVNASNLDFPLLLQLRTLRHGNFTAFCLFGGQYTVDLQSVQDKTQNLIDPFIKVKKKDWMVQVGGGVEFFAEFFKCGLELKYSQGFNNVLIQDHSVVSSPIKSLMNNSWILSITFEGGK